MKRTLAAFTAVALAAGLSLAAVVAPASADDTSTPAPVSSTTTDTTPTATPTSDPTTAPAPATDPTTDTTGTVPAPTFAADTTTRSFSASTAIATTYVTVVWAEPTWKGTTTASYPQTYVAQYSENKETLNVTVPLTCGTQYQVDSYVASPALTTFLAYYSSDTVNHKLAGPDGTQDGKYLASGGRDQAYKLVQNDACPPPCIDDALVTYTYSNDDSNSGDITVPTVKGSSGELCKPFYVTATSWKYTTNAVWPQVVDQVDHVNGTPTGTPAGNIQILKSGVYHYAAQITCGQGDIYASWSATDTTLFPENDNLPGTGYLAGPGSPLAEHFLHDMGFTGPNPTYRQDSTDCWTPTPETGVPTTSTLTCAQGSSNTLTLPAVPGGVWKVTNGSGNSHYSHTYSIGTGVTSWVPTNFNGTYTITLTDGSSTDSYNVTGTSTDWTPQNPRTLDCNTVVTPVKPDVQKIEQCGVDGSITIPSTTGVNYYLGLDLIHALTPGQVISGSGSKLITALPKAGYEFSTDSHDAEFKTWLIDLGHDQTCDVTTVVGTCTADGSVSSVPVSVTLDNTSGSVSSTFLVKVNGTTFDTFSVNAHSKRTVAIGSSPTTGEEVEVYINGSTTPVLLQITKFDGCVPVTPADPTFTPLTCTGTTTNLASITTDGNPNLIYTLDGPGNVGTVFPDAPNSTISGLAAGDYTVSVVAKSGFLLQTSSPTAYPVHVPLAPVNCVGTQQTPVVTFVAPTCTPNPENNVGSAGFSAALTEVQGTITIPSNPNMTFTISDGTTTASATAGEYIEPDGTYTVVATLTATAIADGYTFGTSADYTVSLDGKTATFDPIVFTSECGLPTLASWHSGASGDPATCTLTGTLGTITVVHGSSAADPTDENGKVTYTLVNNANGHVTNLGSTATTASVAPGTYTVKAVPTDPADGLVGNPNAINEIDYTVVVAAPAGSCDDRLAFTGGTIAWLGFILAGGMLFLGIAFLLIRRRGNRTAE